MGTKDTYSTFCVDIVQHLEVVPSLSSGVNSL